MSISSQSLSELFDVVVVHHHRVVVPFKVIDKKKREREEQIVNYLPSPQFFTNQFTKPVVGQLKISVEYLSMRLCRI